MNEETIEPGNGGQKIAKKQNRRKLKEYGFNFLLMFLAVFLGFWADNYREQLSETSKERKYIEGLILNLRDDSVRLSQLIPILKLKAIGLDSLTKMSKENLSITSNRGKVCKYIFMYITGKLALHDFHSNGVTIMQLKNSGDLIILKKDHVSDSVTGFDIKMTDLQKQEDFVEARFEELVKLVWKVSDYTFVNPRDFTFPENIEFPPFTTDKQLRIEFFNSTWNYLDCLEHWIQRLEEHLVDTRQLILFLEEKYDFEKGGTN